MFLFLYITEVIVSCLLIFIILFQKESGGIAKDNNMFGAGARTSTIMRFTYILITVFMLNTLALVKAYQWAQKKEQVQNKK